MRKILRKFNPGGKAAIMAFFSGLLMALAFPPFNLWFLAPLCLLPLFYLSAILPPTKAFIAGWLWGLAQFLGGMYWIMNTMLNYGNMPLMLALLLLLLLCLYLAVYTACFCWLLSRLRPLKIPLWLSAPLLWVGMEFFRGIALTGFPWLSLSLVLSFQPVLLQSAEIWGASGLSLLIVLFSALLAYALNRNLIKSRRIVSLGLALLMAVACWGGGRLMLNNTHMAMQEAPQAMVSVVQGNIPLERLWQRAYREANLMEQLSLSVEASAQAQTRPWLVLWSESAAPFIFLHDVENSLKIMEQAANLQAWLAFGTTGIEVRDDKPGYTNRLFLVDPDGQPYDHYDKVHLVPFGEYVPLAKLFFFVRAIAALSMDMTAGQAGKTLQAGEIVMGPLICYESIFADLARQHKLNGANLLVNPTNDAWFGHTGASQQHMGQLVMRAVENRLSVARAANTGISGFILPTGQVIEQSELFTREQRSAWLPLWQKTTLFNLYGDVLGKLGALGCLLAFIYTIVAPRVLQRRNKNAG